VVLYHYSKNRGIPFCPIFCLSRYPENSIPVSRDPAIFFVFPGPARPEKSRPFYIADLNNYMNFTLNTRRVTPVGSSVGQLTVSFRSNPRGLQYL